MAVTTLGVVETCADVAQVSAWAATLDEPIRLVRFACCGRYVCRCRQDEEEGEVTR